MDEHALGAVIDGYQKHIKKIQLPDEHDRHVLAAAIHCKASHIITFNLKDFPQKYLNPYNIKVQHPDQFLVERFQQQPASVVHAMQQQRSMLKSPPKIQSEYLDILLKQGLAHFIGRVKNEKKP